MPQKLKLTVKSKKGGKYKPIGAFYAAPNGAFAAQIYRHARVTIIVDGQKFEAQDVYINLFPADEEDDSSTAGKTAPKPGSEGIARKETAERGQCTSRDEDEEFMIPDFT